MTSPQMRYLWSEVYPSIAEAIDMFLIYTGRPPVGWTAQDVHERWKKSVGVESITKLSRQEAATYMMELEAFAAQCMIYLAQPDEWMRGVDERARDEHYAYILDERKAA